MKSLSKSVDWKKAQNLRDSGRTLNDIALEIGVCEATVQKYTVERKKVQPDKITLDIGKAQALIDAGWTLKAVASELRTSEQIILSNTSPKKQRKTKPLEGIFGGFP